MQKQRYDKPRQEKTLPGRWWQWAIVLLVALGFAGGYAVRSAKQPPKFYDELKPEKPQVALQQARQVDEKLDDLVQQVESDSDTDQVHTISFSQDEINAWLLHSLPKRFPKSLPKEVKELLIRLQPEDSALVMKIQSPFFSGFATATLDIGMGEQPNLVQIQLKRLYSGLFQVPVGKFRRSIVAGANRSGLYTTWDSDDLPAELTIDLNETLTDQLVRPAKILDVRTEDGIIEIDYQFLNEDAIAHAGSKHYVTSGR